MALKKIREFPGLQKQAPETIQKHAMEQALRNAQYAHDMQLLDLRNEFVCRESKLRQEYLDQVAALTGGETE